MSVAKIDFIQVDESAKPLFSILIPSWNNLPLLKLCIESIRKNSVYPHQIVVHANEATDGTLEWLKENGISHTYSARNVGVCYGFNAPYSLAKADYICLLDDDMYVCPGWDKALWDEIQKLDDHYFCISGGGGGGRGGGDSVAAVCEQLWLCDRAPQFWKKIFGI